MNDLPSRRHNRLADYDYSANGAYFITVCTEGKKCILCKISRSHDTSVGDDLPGVPQTDMTVYGAVTDKIITQMRNFYDSMAIDNYVIMPNHIHLIIRIEGGAPGTSHPTVSEFIGTMRRFINREIGHNIWQRSFYDHVIRDEADYEVRYNYIDDNPRRWSEDELFTAE